MSNGKAKSELEKWATDKGTRRCLTCRDAQICELTREFLEMMDMGGTARSLMSFHAWLAQAQGYELSYAALRNHAIHCEGWAAK
tara:strand:+ start:1618 stop:1869 length:252 start_codon:yes stop_codon:yes gene_type:complete